MFLVFIEIIVYEIVLHLGFDTSDLKFSGDLYVFDMETYTWRYVRERERERKIIL